MRGILPSSLRLNDLIDKEGTPLVDTGISDAWGIPADNELTALMYDIMIRSYQWSYINYDNKEQFVYWLKFYWDKTLPRYLPLIKSQVALSENMYKARVEEYKGDRTETTTPDLTKETTYKLGDKVTLEHGRKMTHERNLGEDSGTTQYEQALTEDKRSLTGSESNSYTGSDITLRSGENVDTRRETGKSELKVVHGDNNTITVYDADKFRSVLSTMSVMDAFIDEFAPLFNSILFAY